MLGHALNRHAWDEAIGIVRALGQYWKTRGLGEEAGAWADRILDAIEDPGQTTPGGPASSLWLYTTIEQATRQKAAGQLDLAGYTYRHALAYLQDEPETEWTRSNISVIYHHLGMTAEERGRLDEAEDWYRQSLTIKEQLGNRRGMALTYAQLGRLAEDRTQAPLALEWNIRCVTLFDEFPSTMTGTGPSALVRLSRQLGMPALQAAWQQITSQPVPPEVRDYVISHHDDDQPGGTS
jgi:tetratricopeptide (TPR) repeat protein